MKKSLVVISICLIFTSITYAEDIDENQLFSEPTSVSTQNISADIAAEMDRESLAFSGELRSKGIYNVARDWLEQKGPFSSNTLTNYSDGNLFLDVRLKKGIKAFLNLSAASTPQGVSGNSTLLDLKEFFVDLNFNKVIYLRTGKQVLQWGRNYLWNPTDLINIQKKSFLDLNLYRTGVYGSRVHVPNGAGRNIYAFLDFSDATNIDRISVAAKYEFLLGNSEYSFSAWTKKDYYPVYGFDFSSRIAGVDIRGESALSYGENNPLLRVNADGSVIEYKVTSRWVPKVSLGCTKTFDWELADRISLIGEFYYNNSGYDKNIFKNAAAVSILQQRKLYQPNYHGKYYGAIFTTISKYPIEDMSVNANAISNLSDGSMIISTGISYQLVNNFTLGFNANSYFGPEYAEYTFVGTRMSFDISTAIVF